MLGTNDCKTRFALTASDVAAGVRELANLILTSGCGPEGRAPRLLVMCPAPLNYTREPDYCASFDDNSNRISRELPAKFARFTREIGCDYLDLGPIASVSEKDGIHLDPDQHQKVAEAVVVKIREILG